jgi:hypothetical protein
MGRDTRLAWHCLAATSIAATCHAMPGHAAPRRAAPGLASTLLRHVNVVNQLPFHHRGPANSGPLRPPKPSVLD